MTILVNIRREVEQRNSCNFKSIWYAYAHKIYDKKTEQDLTPQPYPRSKKEAMSYIKEKGWAIG